ncbi:MAG TPA: enoyl-CoA hydratase-related protein [Jatrophihabitans sp.]|nr:enoyl-CoA hydratase-related protein [Jatrophihabitans sp.]
MTDQSTEDRSVELRLDAGVAEIVLDRPSRLNAMTAAMVREILDAVDAVEAAQARVVLLTANGRAFSAGRDISDAKPGAEDGGQVLAEIFNPMMQRVADLPVPTIAAVQGACMGTGLGLALACDVVLAADDAKFASPFAKIGAVLDSGAHKAFVQRLGPARALDLIYSGRTLSGAEAASCGLVSRSMPAADLPTTAREYAATLAAGPALALAESKRLVRRLSDQPATLAEVLALEAHAQHRASETADYVEGFTAFLERRPPKFTGG